jgi:hypothetical protein
MHSEICTVLDGAQEKTEAAVTELATTLRAELEVVDGELDATVQQVAPSPKVTPLPYCVARHASHLGNQDASPSGGVPPAVCPVLGHSANIWWLPTAARCCSAVAPRSASTSLPSFVALCHSGLLRYSCNLGVALVCCMLCRLQLEDPCSESHGARVQQSNLVAY